MAERPLAALSKVERVPSPRDRAERMQSCQSSHLSKILASTNNPALDISMK